MAEVCTTSGTMNRLRFLAGAFTVRPLFPEQYPAETYLDVRTACLLRGERAGQGKCALPLPQLHRAGHAEQG